MKCPACGVTVGDRQSICPHCDHIIDDSFLKGAEPLKKGTPVAGSSEPKVRPSRAQEPVRPPVPADTRPPPSDMEQALERLGAFLRGFNGGDSIAFWATLVTLVLSVMPWQVGTDGSESSAYANLGFFAVALAAGCGACLVVRRLGSPALRMGEGGLTLLQRGLSAVSFGLVLFCLQHFSWTRDFAFGDTVKTVTSRPGFGAAGAVLSTGITLIGSFLGLRLGRGRP